MTSTKGAQFFFPVKCELTCESDVVAAFEYAINTFGGVDILINTAGIVGTFGLFDEGTLDHMKAVVDTNLMAVVSCTQKAFKSMMDRDAAG